MSCQQSSLRPRPLYGALLSRCVGLGRPPRRFEGLSLAVTRDRPVRFVCPTEVRVLCLSGTAWITTEADIRDVVLKAGQTHCASSRARLFINGMPCCELRIERVAQ